MDSWDQEFAERTPLLAPLRETARQLACSDWPDRTLLQELLARVEVCTATGKPLQLVRDAAAGSAPYEIRLYERGELVFRERNWHDLLNVLIWLALPAAKAALNARHYAAYEQMPAGGRGAVRDALTLFDEDGVIVLAADPGLLQLIRDFQWKRLFWEQRADVVGNMCFLPFGHALCEKALIPFRGMTGRGLLLEVDRAFLALAPTQQLASIDNLVARQLADTGVLQRTRDLAPVPVLGVPGWYSANECAEYYDDSGYFRPGRSRRIAGLNAGKGDT